MPSCRSDISVIIRTAGRPGCYLDRAIASVKAQTCPPRLLFISDDSGTQKQTIPSGKLRVQWIERDPAQTANRSAALNRAVRCADSDWLAFLDDDDTWHPEFLARMGAAVTARFPGVNIGAIVCRTQALYERESNGQFTELGQEPFNPWLVKVTLSGLVRQNLFTNNAVLWHRRVFDEIGGYREDLDVLEDWEFNVRAAARFELLVVPEVLAHYHRRLEARAGEGANSSLQAHDRARSRLATEWRAVGWLPADRGWHWIGNRWREARHRWARWQFDRRWRLAR